MYDYSDNIEKFWEKKVSLPKDFKDKLYDRRQSNRDRLIARLPDNIKNISISNSSFKPQGSMAMQTIIQTKFENEEYDIDDGLVLLKKELIDENEKELSPEEVRKKVLNSLKDERFTKQPKLCTNCVRVFYADENEEKHHVDFPVYRKFENKKGDDVRELANEKEWIESNPTQVNVWFENEVKYHNSIIADKGTQLRKLTQLLKRFARSRETWDLPNGMKLTMLVSECLPEYNSRIDEAFRNLLKELDVRLEKNLEIYNLAHPDKPTITRSVKDRNVVDLHDKIILALEKLEVLDELECTKNDAKKTWDWVFQTDGYFDDIENEDDKNKANVVNSIPTSPVNHKGGGRFG